MQQIKTPLLASGAVAGYLIVAKEKENQDQEQNKGEAATWETY